MKIYDLLWKRNNQEKSGKVFWEKVGMHITKLPFKIFTFIIFRKGLQNRVKYFLIF